MFHMIALEQTFVNGPLQKISLAVSESNRFYQYFIYLYGPVDKGGEYVRSMVE